MLKTGKQCLCKQAKQEKENETWMDELYNMDCEAHFC